MADIFEAYAAKTHSQAKPKLIGPIATRAAARLRYADIVAELEACEDADMLSAYLDSIKSETTQFRAELQYFWEGDGFDFIGLSGEIERATARCDANPAHPGNW